MPKPKLLLLGCLAFMTMGRLSSAEVKLSIRAPAGPSETLRRVELAIEGVPAVSNPFDPSVIQVDLEAIAPSGAKLPVPAFWGGEFERKLESNREVLTAIGEPGWRVRYLPLESGRHALNVIGRIEGQIVARGSTLLDVAPATGRGLVRTDAGSRYFRFDDGTPLFLNGLCACWHGRRGTYDYDDWLAAYEQAGSGFSREPSPIAADRWSAEGTKGCQPEERSTTWAPGMCSAMRCRVRLHQRWQRSRMALSDVAMISLVSERTLSGLPAWRNAAVANLTDRIAAHLRGRGRDGFVCQARQILR